jgi:hypothetical protein
METFRMISFNLRHSALGPKGLSPSMKWAYYALGKLARWKDTKRTGRIGWDTFWQGWLKLQERVDSFHAAALVQASLHEAST